MTHSRAHFFDKKREKKERNKEKKKKKPPVYLTCNTIIAVKHILIEHADLVKVRQKYFEERSLYSLFRNVNPAKFFNYLKEIGMLNKI